MNTDLRALADELGWEMLQLGQPPSITPDVDVLVFLAVRWSGYDPVALRAVASGLTPKLRVQLSDLDWVAQPEGAQLTEMLPGVSESIIATPVGALYHHGSPVVFAQGSEAVRKTKWAVPPE